MSPQLRTACVPAIPPSTLAWPHTHTHTHTQTHTHTHRHTHTHNTRTTHIHHLHLPSTPTRSPDTRCVTAQPALTYTAAHSLLAPLCDSAPASAGPGHDCARARVRLPRSTSTCLFSRPTCICVVLRMGVQSLWTLHACLQSIAGVPQVRIARWDARVKLAQPCYTACALPANSCTCHAQWGCARTCLPPRPPARRLASCGQPAPVPRPSVAQPLLAASFPSVKAQDGVMRVRDPACEPAGVAWQLRSQRERAQDSSAHEKRCSAKAIIGYKSSTSKHRCPARVRAGLETNCSAGRTLVCEHIRFPRMC